MATVRRRNTSGLKRGGPGRKKGVPNKVTVEARELCRELLASVNYRKNLQKRLDKGRIAPAVETTLWHYAYGKPKETVKHEGDVPVSFTISVERATRDE